MEKSYWTSVETVTNSAYNDPNDTYTITRYWRPNIKLTDTEFIINGGINHTDNQKGVVLLAADRDYSKPSDEPYSKSALVAAVFGSFSRDQYAWLIREMLNRGGLGALGDAHITCHRETESNQKDKMYFLFFSGRPDIDQETSISYIDGIKLFHEYFNTFKRFVDDFAPDIRQSTRVLFSGKKDENGEPIFGDFPWYPDFLKELENLNKLYAELVAKGEIKE